MALAWASHQSLSTVSSVMETRSGGNPSEIIMSRPAEEAVRTWPARLKTAGQMIFFAASFSLLSSRGSMREASVPKMNGMPTQRAAK